MVWTKLSAVKYISNDFSLISHSYFEVEADQLLNLPVTLTEDELWNQVRYAPKNLPTGSFDLLPALELIRLNHLPIKPYKANAQLEKGKYSLTIQSLQRQLIICFQQNFRIPLRVGKKITPIRAITAALLNGFIPKGVNTGVKTTANQNHLELHLNSINYAQYIILV